MRPKIQSELNNEQIQVILENLRNSGQFFTDWNKFQLEKFRDHFRFLNFAMKQQLTRRNEPVDFLGIILKGKADVIMDHKSQSVIGVGDMIGGMSLYRMTGCEVQQFDIYAKEAGIMALIRKDDLKLLAKRQPELNAQLQRSISLGLLNIVSQQYLDKNYTCELHHKINHTTNKKLLLYLDQLALTKEEIASINDPKNRNKQSILQENKSFRQSWNQLEQKEKRLFIQFSNSIELEQNQNLIINGQKGDQFFILIHGSISSNLNSYEPGQLIGFKQFITEEGFTQTYTSQTDSLLIRMTKQNFQDMLKLSPVSGSNIIAMFTRYECDQMRKIFEQIFPVERKKLFKQVELLAEKLKNPDKPLTKKEQFTIPQLMNNYFELQITKTKLLDLDLIDKEQAQSNIAPLFVLDTFKDLVAQRGYQGNEIKDRKDPMILTGMSWFMREKVEEQHKENIKKKLEMKKLRKLGIRTIIDQNDEEYKNQQNENDIFEDLNNDFFLQQAELDKANEYIYLLEDQVQKLKDDLQFAKEEHQIILSKLRKHQMHMQLVRLERFSEDFHEEQLLKKRTTLFDTFKQQSIDNKLYRSAVLVADKMLSTLHQSQIIK